MKIRRSHRSRRALFASAEPLERRCLLSASLVISEFMASNSKTLKDSAGDYADWLEIHNAGDADANLNNYFLTDSAGNPEAWRFPAQTLSAGAYLVVFADGTTTPPVANTELHANFKLSASGEYLALINAADDSVQFAYSPQFPAQTADISYGLSDANNPNSTQVFFSVPTPGAPNNPSVAQPTFSVPGQVFTGTLSVTLSDATPGAAIHYTTDNSLPTSSSPTYTTPLSLTASTPLRIFATAAGFTSSPITSQTYERVDSTVTSVQNTNLPIIIINTYGGIMSEASDSDIPGSASFIDTTNGTANVLTSAEDYQGRIGIHIRGSTSENYAKQQYLIDLWDENNNGKDASLFGMPADDSWVLYAPFTELPLMQDQLAYQLANQTGEYASKTQFVEVYMSTGTATGSTAYAGNTQTINSSSNYMGIFILTEKIKADSDRVDVGGEISATNPNGGFIVAQDRYTTNPKDYFPTSQEGVHMVYNDPDSDPTITTQNPAGNIATAWDNFENALFTGNAGAGQAWDTPGNPSYYGNFINIQSFVDYYLLNEMMRNIDSFWLSTYYTKSADTVVNGAVTQRGLISAGPVWDFNLSLGAANYNQSADSDGWDTNTLTPAPGAGGVSGFNPQDPYFQRLLTDPNFVQAVSDRWNQLRKGVLSTSSLTADITADVKLLSDNTSVYPTGVNPTGTTSPLMRNFQKWPELGVYETTQGMYDPAGSWIQDVNLMQNWLIARVNWMDSQFAPQPTITPGGDFGTTTTVTMSPVGAATTSDTTLFSPDPTTAVQWFVPSSAQQALGWQSYNYVYPTTPSSPAAAVWSSGFGGVGYDAQTSPVNFLPFIGNDGSTTATNTQAKTIQTQMSGVNPTIYVRYTFNIASTDALNAIGALILEMRYDDGFVAYINGVRVMDANSPENFNPLDNTTSTPAYRQTSSGGSSGNDNLAITLRQFDISSVKSLLRVGANVLAIQGLNSGSGSNDLLIDPVLVSRQYVYPTAGSVYYTTDGSDPRTNTGTLSCSAHLYNSALSLTANTEIKARTYNNGVWGAISDQVYDFTATSLRITELMYNPPPGANFPVQNFEYIEVQNVSSSPLSLAGFQITNGVTFSFPDVSLAPGAYGVIVKDPNAFASRYGSSPNVLGTYTGSLDNSGETVTIEDGFSNVVESFKYLPSWYPGTAGQGYSLVVASPAGDTSALNSAVGWRSSFAPDGAPGIADTDSVVPAVTSWLFTENGSTGQPTLRLNFSSSVSADSPSNLSVVNTLTSSSINPSSFAIDGSSITFTFPATMPSGDYLFTLPAASVFNISGITASANQTLNLLLVRSGSTYSLPALTSGLVIQQLALGVASSLDIGTDSVVINSSTVTPDSVRQLLSTGYASGAWNGPGIITSASAGHHSIAYVRASDIGITTFNSQPLNSNAVLLKYTLAGDANFDGQINADDYALTDRGIAKGFTNWAGGDFNYDGLVTSADLAILDQSAAAAANPPPSEPVIVTTPLQTSPPPSTPPVSIPPVIIAAPPAAPVLTTPTPLPTTPTTTTQKTTTSTTSKTKTPTPTKKKTTSPKTVKPTPKPTPKKTKPALKSKTILKSQTKSKPAVKVQPPAFHPKIFSSIPILSQSPEMYSALSAKPRL